MAGAIPVPAPAQALSMNLFLVAGHPQINPNPGSPNARFAPGAYPTQAKEHHQACYHCAFALMTGDQWHQHCAGTSDIDVLSTALNPAEAWRSRGMEEYRFLSVNVMRHTGSGVSTVTSSVAPSLLPSSLDTVLNTATPVAFVGNKATINHDHQQRIHWVTSEARLA
ncbi:hypothetical protein F5B20DRAFT_589462 [Whalleya microplaca]|nr:hypothetical protein F5B20DRAFT_589462 [Whalleya microplaca]